MYRDALYETKSEEVWLRVHVHVSLYHIDLGLSNCIGM